ncbi:hypothetical protein M9458_050362, partial [Cirrhinus mrigala]
PIQVTAGLHDSSQVTADPPEPCHVSADPPEPRHVSADIPEPCQVLAVLPEPHQVSSHLPSHAEPTLSNPTACTPSSPAGIPLSSVLPVMAITILSVWATHCAPEASSDHKSVLKASPVHEFVPVPPEVSMYALEPPKEGASIHELTASYVHKSAPEVSSVHESVPGASLVTESVPMPPEVAASTAEPPQGAASSYELSAHHVTAKEAYHELSACHVTAKEAKEIVHELSALLWMSFVPLWVSLLLSALSALPALSAPP